MLVEEPVCPLSNHPASLWLRAPGDPSRLYLDKTYSLYWCTWCQYGFLHPRPSTGEVAEAHALPEYYTHHVHEKEEIPSKRTFLQKARGHLAWRLDWGSDLYTSLRKNYLKQSGQHICEIGCGNGDLALALLKDGFYVMAIESDALARGIAQKRGVEVWNGTAEQLPASLAERNFDVVILSHVLEHCLDPIAALKNAYTLAKPGGILVCEVPNNKAFALYMAGNAWRWLDVPRHLNFFTENSLSLLSRQCHWNPKNFEYTGYFRMFTPERIQEEKKIWQFYHQRDPKSTTYFKPAAWKTWLMLGFSSLCPKIMKYDSVRLIAKKGE